MKLAKDTLDRSDSSLLKAGQIIGKAVDYLLSRLSVSLDPMAFSPETMTLADREAKAGELYEFGQECLVTGRIATAIPMLLKAHELIPYNPEYRLAHLYGLCNSPQHFSELAGLEKEIPESLSQDPRCREIRAAIHYFRKDKEKARACLQEQIDQGLRFRSFAGNLMAGVLLFDNSKERASIYFQWAIALVPDNLEAHRCLLLCHENLGQKAEAETERKIIEFLQ